MTVKTTHKDYDRLSPLWKRCRDTVAGQRAMHEAGEEYLPKLKAEDPKDYKARVKRSDYFNATWRTISGLVGMAFRKEPTRDIPGALETYSANITMSGVNLDALAEQLVEEVLEVGRVGLLVDHPAMPEGVSAMSVEAAERLGHRPCLKVYKAETIRNWRFRSVNNAWMLVQVVLGETAAVEKDEFETEAEDRYRVIDLDERGFYRQRVFKSEDGKDVLLEGPVYPLMRGQPMTTIPFAMIGRSGMGDDADEPPLIDLVDANIAHYQMNSDYRHGLHFTGLPTLFLTGLQQEDGAAPFYIGGQAAIVSQHPDADGKYIEFTGQGLGALKEAIDATERRMAVLGARMIADETRQVETLGATQIKRTGENSILSRIVTVVSEAVEWGLRTMADWQGVTGEVVYQINREFAPVILDAQRLTALVAAWQNGALTEAELYDMLQRGDVIDGQKSFEEHQTEADLGAGPARPSNDTGAIAA